jgi:hypothetical protein
MAGLAGACHQRDNNQKRLESLAEQDTCGVEEIWDSGMGHGDVIFRLRIAAKRN